MPEGVVGRPEITSGSCVETKFGQLPGKTLVLDHKVFDQALRFIQLTLNPRKAPGKSICHQASDQPGEGESDGDDPFGATHIWGDCILMTRLKLAWLTLFKTGSIGDQESRV